MLKSVTIKLVW